MFCPIISKEEASSGIEGITFLFSSTPLGSGYDTDVCKESSSI